MFQQAKSTASNTTIATSSIDPIAPSKAMPAPSIAPKCVQCKAADLHYFCGQLPPGCTFTSADQIHCTACCSHSMNRGRVCSQLFTAMTPAFYCAKCQASFCYLCGMTSIPITVEWWSEDPRNTGSWMPYNAADTAVIEAGYQKQQSTVTISIMGNSFTVDVKKMAQLNNQGGSRKIERRVKGGSSSTSVGSSNTTASVTNVAQAPPLPPDVPPNCGTCQTLMTLTTTPPAGYNNYGDYYCKDCNVFKQIAASTPAYHCVHCGTFDYCKGCAPKHVSHPKCHQCAKEFIWTTAAPMKGGGKIGAAATVSLNYSTYGEYQCVKCKTKTNFIVTPGYHCESCGGDGEEHDEKKEMMMIVSAPKKNNKYDLCGKCAVIQMTRDALRGLLSGELAELFLQNVTPPSKVIGDEDQLSEFLRDIFPESWNSSPGSIDVQFFLFACKTKSWRSLSFQEFEKACVQYRWEEKRKKSKHPPHSKEITKEDLAKAEKKDEEERDDRIMNLPAGVNSLDGKWTVEWVAQPQATHRPIELKKGFWELGGYKYQLYELDEEGGGGQKKGEKKNLAFQWQDGTLQKILQTFPEEVHWSVIKNNKHVETIIWKRRKDDKIAVGKEKEEEEGKLDLPNFVNNMIHTIEKLKQDVANDSAAYSAFHSWCYGKYLRGSPTILFLPTDVALQKMKNVLMLFHGKERKREDFDAQQEALFAFLLNHVKGVTQKLWDDVCSFLISPQEQQQDPFCSIAIDEFVVAMKGGAET